MQVAKNIQIKSEPNSSSNNSWEDEIFMENDIQPAIEMVSEILQNLTDCKEGLESCRFKGFKDFTKEVQINWRKSRDIRANVKNEHQTQTQNQAMGQDYQIQEIQQLTDTATHLIYNYQRTVKQIRQRHFKTHKILFGSMITVIRDLKMSMVQNSGIFWVVEILEHETWRIIESKKIKIKLARQTFMEEQQAMQQQQQVMQQQQQILNPEIQSQPTKRGRGRGKRVNAPIAQIDQGLKMDQSQMGQANQSQYSMPATNLVDESKTVLTYAAYMASDEKKSYEYVYNYEGMDEKMIAQRKRRIELKKMFEDMLLAESQKNVPAQSLQQTSIIQPLTMQVPMMQQPQMQQAPTLQAAMPQIQQPMQTMPQIYQQDQQQVYQPPQVQPSSHENNESIASKTTVACSLSDGVKQTGHMNNSVNSQQNNQSNEFSDQAISEQKSNNTFNNNEIQNAQVTAQINNQMNPTSTTTIAEQSKSQQQAASSMFMAPPLGALDDEEIKDEIIDYPQTFKNIVSTANKYLPLYRKFLTVDQSTLPELTSDPFINENHQIQSDPSQMSTICKRMSLLLNGQGIKCNDCFTSVTDQQALHDHRAFYKCGDQEAQMEMQQSNNYRSPYRFLKIESTKFICPFGSTFTTTCAKGIRKHLVNKYSDVDLKKWGYSRNILYREYLMLLEKQDAGDEQQQQLVGMKRTHSQVSPDDDDSEDIFQM